MYFSYVYEKGMRDQNQDAILVRSSLFQSGTLSMAVVCDGMGGMECGEKASDYLIASLDSWFDQVLIPLVSSNEINHFRLRKAIKSKGFLLFRQLNEELFLQMRRQHIHLGSTASIFISYGHFYYIFHIGDSRIYFINKHSIFHPIRQKTKDHNCKHMLTRCVGLNKNWKPDFMCGLLHRSHVLLCTDGFYRKRKPDLWERCLDRKKMRDERIIRKRLNELAKANLNCGETDNMSAVYIVLNEGKEGTI